MYEVVVIGGGIAGCAAAYYLARDGVEVLLLEQGELNGLASGSNAGSLHAQIPHEPFVEKGDLWARQFLPCVRLLRASITLWATLENELGEDLEVDFGGGLLVASSERQLREIEAKARLEREAGLEIELLDSTALRREAGYVSAAMIGGALCRQEGKANPLLAAPALARAARARGARIQPRVRVTGISRGGAGFEVHTSSGTFRAKRVVNAAGVQAGRLAEMVGAGLDIEAHPIQVSVTEPAAKLIPHLLYYAGAKLTMKQSRIGTILIGGGWPARLDDRGRPVTDTAALAENLSVAIEVVPAVSSLTLIRSWAAFVNGTDSWLPILGEAPDAPGFFVCYVPWMGFTAGPAAGLVIASLLQGKDAPLNVDLRPFSLSPTAN